MPGVRAVEPLQHRFAYIGTDLQDLYGVDPSTITGVTALQDTYFQGGTADQLMRRAAAQPDSILVSAETVKDYQLAPRRHRSTCGCTTPRTHQLDHRAVPLRRGGHRVPHRPQGQLLRRQRRLRRRNTPAATPSARSWSTPADATPPPSPSGSARCSGPGATVTDIATTRGSVGSSLTAVDLAGLTRVELGFALCLAAASGGLVLALGLTERRRGFVIATALGATHRQLRSFVLAEAAILVACGLTAGAVLGWALTRMLVTMLSGVFDPPPAALSVPWTYLAATVVAIVIAIGAVSATTVRLARLSPLTVLGEL